MGVYSKKNKDGKLRWYIDFYVDGVRKRKCIGHLKTKAKTEWARCTTKVDDGQYIVEPRGGILFKDFANLWLQEREAHLKRSSFCDYKCIFER